MADAKFVIDGDEYPIPTLATFDMDEAILLYETTGFGLEDLVYDENADDAEDVQARFRHPGLLKTLLLVAYQRGNPHLARKKAAEMISHSNYADAFVQLMGSASGDGDAESPPSEDTTKKPPGSSPRSSSGNSKPGSATPSGSGSGSSTSSPTAPGTSGRDVDRPTSWTPELLMPYPDTRERTPAA